MSDKKAQLMLLTVSIISGSGFIAITRILGEGVFPLQLIFARFSIAAVVMAMFLNKNIKEIKKSEVICGMILGIFTSIGFTLQFTGLLYTSVSNNSFLVTTYVLIAPVFFWIITRVRPDAYLIVSILMSLVGIAFLTLDSKLSIGKGDVFSLASAVFYALNVVATFKFLGKNKPLYVTSVQFATVAVITGLLSIRHGFWPHITLGAKFGILYLSLVSTVTSYLLQNFAFKYTAPAKSSAILSTQCVFSMIFSVAFLGEKLTLKTVLSSLIIFVAIFISATKPDFKTLFKPKRLKKPS
ncbi:MAG: DMT family transporter [Lachnospiraceae bacterium]|nr:DMT family transporter [Lachnospiraceae bacterium]